MRAEGCLLILSGLPLILSPQKDRGCGCVLIRSLASTSCTARHNSRWDKRGPNRHDDHAHGRHRAEDGSNRRSILWRNKFVS